jgi:hypothetical protein
MSTSLKSPDGLKDAEYEKGQLSHRPPILCIPMVDVVTPKEESQIFKIKLPDASHLSMPIYSCGNNEEHLLHIVAGATQEVPSACQGCCVMVRGIDESLGSRGILRHHLDDRRCYGPQGGD